MKQMTLNLPSANTYEPNQDTTLIVSFSGGRTSGYMTHKLLQEKDQWKDIIVIFTIHYISNLTTKPYC
jgi:predicted phosphoadenosine phosphosulfate sulfurtransferase